MSDDIVKMLRIGEREGVDGWWGTMAEAADEIERLRAGLAAERERVAKLCKALNFYAGDDNYDNYEFAAIVDGGRRAREALKVYSGDNNYEFAVIVDGGRRAREALKDGGEG